VHISVSYGHPQPGPLSSIKQEHSSVDVHSQSAVLTSGNSLPTDIRLIDSQPAFDVH